MSLEGEAAGLPVLVVMTRWPASGRCKRRLAATLGGGSAARIQARLISHTVAVAASLAKAGVLEARIAVSGAGQKASRRWLTSQQGVSINAQSRGGLGNRLCHEVLRARAHRPSTPVILIGTDLPDLHQQDLLIAVDKLKRSPLVLGPSHDGGYWLLGLAAEEQDPHWAFHSIPWGTDAVCRLTVEKARHRGITPELLSWRNDIDTISDLQGWLA